jgi:hypothetical protein
VAIYTLYPDGDGAIVEWDSTDTTHYTEIDEGVVGADDGDYIHTGTANDRDVIDFEDPGVAGVSYLELTVRAQLNDDAGTGRLRVDLAHSGGTPITGSPQYITAADLGGYGVLGSKALNWTPSTPLTAFQAASLQVRFTLLAT